MGKKTQHKGRNPRKAIRRVPAGSAQSVSEPDAEDEEVKGTEACNHYSKGSDELNQILLGIHSSSYNVVSCEHCREEPSSKRGNKEKGKQHKKKGGARASEAKSESSIIWVCLDCGRYFCGGAVKDTEPYGHARRHAKQDRHPWAVRFDNPLICWCFSCNLLVPIEMPEGVRGEERSTMDIEDGCLRDNAGQGKGNEIGGYPSAENLKGHTIRGLANLGNTCFFNSVMQNLFAMDMLRESLSNMERPFGPLTMALKKLFLETSGSADSKGSLTPKALFGCICAKAPQFRGYQQQDSHELLQYLLDGLYTEEANARRVSSEQDKANLNSRASFVDIIFGGQLSSTVSCLECGHTSIVHEPFLNLSLPVPSKKIPPKRVPPPLPKKGKPPLRERSKNKKFREKGLAKGATVNEHHKVENINSPKEYTDHCVPASEPEHNVDVKVEDEPCWMDYIGPSMIADDTSLVSENCEIQNVDAKVEEQFSWMDYIGPSMMADNTNSITQNSENSAAQCSVTRQICQGENNVQCVLYSQNEGYSKEPMVSSDSFREYSCTNEVPSSCTNDSDVILLPSKEVDPPVMEISRMVSCSQSMENLPLVDALATESSVQTTSIAGCEQAEVDFDGFGDLFNEPEASSESKTETAACQEMDMTVWAGNSSESNPDEVDNTNAPVSINSCLALFTKPELLSDEHAWHCERCSEILSHQHVERKEGKRPTVRFNKSEALKSQVDRGGIESKKALPDSEVDYVGSTELEVLGNGKVASNSINLDSHAEKFEDPNAEVNRSQKPLRFVGGSDSMRHKNGEVSNEGNKTLDSTHSEEAQCTDVILKVEDSQYLSCPPVHEKTPPKKSSGNRDSDSCGINYTNKVQCIEQALAATSISSPNHVETNLWNSCEKDDFSELNQMEKNSRRLLAGAHPSDDNRGTAMKPKSKMVKMVKRDATKRILINKPPPILTVHLKRFGQDSRGRLSKLSGHVSFQETLDIRPYMDPRCEDKEKCCYRLVGVVEHSGSMSGGHYVAYVRGDKSRGRGQESGGSAWFYASDAHVRETSLSEVLQSEAYILFYQRVR